MRRAAVVHSNRNFSQYQEDISDLAKFARNANITPSLGIGTGILNFGVATILADVVAVNGQPAKGLYAARDRWIATRPIRDERYPSANAFIENVVFSKLDTNARWLG